MKIASILSIVALIASMATNGCSEDGPVTNPRQEEPQKVVKEEGFARGADVSWLTQMEAEGSSSTRRTRIAKRWSVWNSCVIIAESTLSVFVYGLTRKTAGTT